MIKEIKTAVSAFANGVEKVVTEMSKDTATTKKDNKEEKMEKAKEKEKIVISVPDRAIVNGGILTLKVIRDKELVVKEIDYKETEPDTQFRATVE